MAAGYTTSLDLGDMSDVLADDGLGTMGMHGTANYTSDHPGDSVAVMLVPADEYQHMKCMVKTAESVKVFAIEERDSAIESEALQRARAEGEQEEAEQQEGRREQRERLVEAQDGQQHEQPQRRRAARLAQHLRRHLLVAHLRAVDAEDVVADVQRIACHRYAMNRCIIIVVDLEDTAPEAVLLLKGVRI